MRTELSIAFAVALVCAAPLAAADEPLKVEVAAGSSQLIRLGDRIQRVSTGSGEVADVAAFPPDQVLITGKHPGHATATIWTEGGDVRVVNITVGYQIEEMRAALAKAIPGAKNLDLQTAGAAVVITGQVPTVEDVERVETLVRSYAAGGLGNPNVPLVNMLTVRGGQQVQLEVSFAEVSRSALREIGFNFWSKKAYDGSGYAGGVLAPTNGLDNLAPELGNAPGVEGLNQRDVEFGSGGDALNDAVPLVQAPLSGAFGFVFSSTLGGFPFSAAVSLLSNKGYARTLAEPTLVAMSGKEASFLAGGEFPIPLPQSLGQIAVEFRKFGIQLAFVPTVIGDDIQLDLAVTVSDIDFSLGVNLASTRVPGLTERHSQTTVRLKDGQSFVIAGLLSDSVRSNVDKVPWLGDVPLLGALFRSSSYRREETELLVVVTAHLVAPLDERPRLPGEDMTTDPSDLELFLLGSGESMRTEASSPRPGKAKSGRQAPAGAVGFKR